MVEVKCTPAVFAGTWQMPQTQKGAAEWPLLILQVWK